MNIQLFGTQTCNDTKNAQRSTPLLWLCQRKAFVDSLLKLHHRYTAIQTYGIPVFPIHMPAREIPLSIY